jgi:hypothetical protein
MSRKRRLLLGALVIACAGVVLGTLALLPPRPAATRENFERLQPGMTRAEVVAILGDNSAGCKFIWEGETGSVCIDFDDDDRVESKCWFNQPDGRTAWEKFVDRVVRREQPARALVITR